MSENITDQATAAAALRRVRDNLDDATTKASTSMDELREVIILVRPSGLLSVAEMAEAVGRERNYVDSIWSSFGGTTRDEQTGRVRQTRVAVADADETDIETARYNLTQAAHRQSHASAAAQRALGERNRVVAMVYASELLGPTDIAREVGIDRNHVLRIARRAGIPPVHRQGSRNQYSTAVPSA